MFLRYFNYNGKYNNVLANNFIILHMLSFLIQTYGIDNIGMVCITLALFIAVLMGLKF